MQLNLKSKSRYLAVSLGHQWHRLLATFLGIAILWFAIDSVYTSIQDVSGPRLYELSTISSNTVHLSIDSFDPDTDKVQVTAKPEYDGLFADAEIQRLLPKALQPRALAKVVSGVKLSGLNLEDLSPELNAGGLRLAQIGLNPPQDKCTAPSKKPIEEAQTGVWKALEAPLDRNFFSIWRGPEMYPFDEYLVVGRANRMMKACFEGSEYNQNSTLAISVNLPGYSVREASSAELANWPALANSSFAAESRQNGVSSKSGEQHAAPAVYDEKMWQEQQVALLIKRPTVIKRMFLLLYGIASVATLFLAVICARDEILKNFVGSLLTIWTIRSLLIPNAPKTSNLVDYFAMFLFAVIASIYISRYLWSMPTKLTEEAR